VAKPLVNVTVVAGTAGTIMFVAAGSDTVAFAHYRFAGEKRLHAGARVQIAI
jgi:hypothetical protein